MINKELFKQLQEISVEKGLEYEEVIDVFAKALVTSGKKVCPPNTTIDVKVNEGKNEILLFTKHLVVEEVVEIEEGEMSQISLSDATKIKPSYKVGDIVEQLLNTKEFGRQAARSAKSTFASDLKALERRKAYEYFKQYEDEMISGVVLEVGDRYITLDLGQKTTTLLPLNELLPNDQLFVNDRISVYVKKVEQTTKEPKIFVSRVERNLVTRLLENFIPEIKDGTIEIKGIARDAGDRCKIAIMSNDPKVDALGSCVGEGGTRIREVVNALNGEKIDLYKYSDDVEEMIKNSLQPASVTKVLNIDPKTKTSMVIVPDDQLSLAIGKSGQNVRLAVQSCGWKIDIKPTSQAYTEGLLEGHLFNEQA